MANLLTLFIYWSLILSLLVALATTGLAVSYLVSSNDRFRLRQLPGDFTVIGLCYLIVASLVLANAFGEIDRTFLTAILALPVVCAAFKFFKYGFGNDKRSKVADLKNTVGTTLIPLSIYSTIGMIPFYSFLSQSISRNFVLTSVTKFNADIGMYLQMSSNLITHGFNDNGKVVGANVGAFARFDHPGAQAALAGKSQILGLLPHQMGIVAASCLLALLGLCVHQIIKGDHKLNDWRLYSIGALVIVNPLVTEMSNQFFYAQLLTVVMMLGFLCLSQRLIVYRETENFAFVFFLGISAFVTSPEVAVMLIAIFFLPFCYTYLSKRPVFSSFRLNRQVIKSVVLPVLIFSSVYPFVLEEVRVLRRTTQEGIAGWSSSVLSPIGWMGLTPGTYLSSSTALEKLLGGLIVVAIVGLALKLMFSRRRDLNTTLLILVFLSGLLVLVVMASIYGTREYQTWKTAISITPLLIVGVFTVLNTFNKTRKSLYFIVSVMIGAGLASSSINWASITQRNYVNQDLIAITQSMEYQRMTQIDVDLDPMLETMFAVPLLKGEVNLMSKSYFNAGSKERKFACLLTSETRATRLRLMNKVIVQRGKYVIVGNSDC